MQAAGVGGEYWPVSLPGDVDRMAGLDAGEWTPRELRHSFVSLISDSGVPLEEISRLVGHSSTAVTELVYRNKSDPYSNTEQQPWTRSSATQAQKRRTTPRRRTARHHFSSSTRARYRRTASSRRIAPQ